MKTEPNHPINPTEISSENGEQYYSQTGQHQHHITGLTKREYIAGISMQGLLANHLMVEQYKMEYLAEMSVKSADALIQELNKQP